MAECSLVQHLKGTRKCYFFAPSNFFPPPRFYNAIDTSETWPFPSAGTWGNPSFKKMFPVAVVCLGDTKYEV